MPHAQDHQPNATYQPQGTSRTICNTCSQQDLHVDTVRQCSSHRAGHPKLCGSFPRHYIADGPSALSRDQASLNSNDFQLISASSSLHKGYDEPKNISYAIITICLSNADGEQRIRSRFTVELLSGCSVIMIVAHRPVRQALAGLVDSMILSCWHYHAST